LLLGDVGEWGSHLPVRVQIGLETSPESKANTSQRVVSLFDEAVTAFRAPSTPCLGASSQVLGGTVVQSSPKPGGGVGKPPPSSFLRRGFLLPSVPPPLSGCASLTTDKGVIFKSNGLIQSQEWPVGFCPSGEIVVWDQGVEDRVGEEGDSPYPLSVCLLDMPLDWDSDGVEDVDTSFAFLDAMEEDFLRGNKGKRLKTKGRRELQNLKSSINYSDESRPSRSRRGKAQAL
jgi:hypothetical protein